MKAPPHHRAGAGVLTCSNATPNGFDGSSESLRTRRIPQPEAADFKTRLHLEVGEIGSDRYNTGSATSHLIRHDPVNPVPARDADHRKARRAAGPARADLPDSEHIGTGGVSGYRTPTYL